jgi:hypothetical protein
MPSSYTNNLGIELPADGELDAIWGDVVNDNMDILDRAINGTVTLTLSGTSSTLTTSDGTLSDGQYKLLVLAGSPSGTHTITIAPNDAQKIYFVRNTTAQSVVFTQGSGGNVTIATGDSGVLYADGAGAGAAVANLTDHFAMSSVNITGGSIDGAAIGGSSAAAGSFTTGSFSGDLTIADKIVHSGDTNTAIRFPANDTVTVETNGAERMRVDSSGNLLVGKTTDTNSVTTNGINLRPAGYSTFTSTDLEPLQLSRRGTDGAIVVFYKGSTQVGSISVTGSATSYTTSSDYRLKENVAPIQNALGTVAQLNPVTYTWKADGSAGQGFIAHELQAVVPDCVTGEKDAVDKDGKPQYQGVDTSFLVATLVKAIQEQQATITALTARIEALENTQ